MLNIDYYFITAMLPLLYSPNNPLMGKRGGILPRILALQLIWLFLCCLVLVRLCYSFHFSICKMEIIAPCKSFQRIKWGMSVESPVSTQQMIMSLFLLSKTLSILLIGKNIQFRSAFTLVCFYLLLQLANSKKLDSVNTVISILGDQDKFWSKVCFDDLICNACL